MLLTLATLSALFGSGFVPSKEARDGSLRKRCGSTRFTRGNCIAV